MAKTKAAKLLASMIVNQLKSVNWKFYASDEELRIALDIAETLGDPRPLGEWMLKKAQEAGLPVTAIYIIIHNKDQKYSYSQEEEKSILVLSEMHIHALMLYAPRDQQKVSNGVLPATLTNIAKVFGVNRSTVQKAKRGAGGHAIDNMLAYLPHLKDPEKYQYDPHDVCTVLGRDYYDIYCEKAQEWAEGAAAKTASKTRQKLPYLKQEIAEGHITKEEIMEKGSPYWSAYVQHTKEIDAAFDTFATLHFKEMQTAYANHSLLKTNIYFVAPEGTGKSKTMDTVANEVSRCYREHTTKALSIAECANFDPLQQTNAEDILIVNDVRADTLPAGSWTMFTDPERIGYVKSRHTNRPLAASLIMMTSPEPPQQLFYEVCKTSTNVEEPIGQFIRRLSLVVEVLPSSTYEGNRYRLYTPYRKYIGPSEPTIQQMEEMEMSDRFEIHKYEPYFLAQNRNKYINLSYTSPWGLSPSIETYTLNDLVEIIKAIYFKNQLARIANGEFADIVKNPSKVEYDYKKHWGEIGANSLTTEEYETIEHNKHMMFTAVEFARNKCFTEMQKIKYGVSISSDELLPDNYVVPIEANEKYEVTYYTTGKTFRKMYTLLSDLPLRTYAEVAENLKDRNMASSIEIIDGKPQMLNALPYDELCKKGTIAHAAMTYEEICHELNKPSNRVPDDEPF